MRVFPRCRTHGGRGVCRQSVLLWLSSLRAIRACPGGGRMSRDRHRNDSVGDEIGDPPLARALLHHTRAGWLWLPVRVSLGYEWLRTGLEQLRDPNWMDGTAVLAFWWDAVDAPGSADNASAAYGWYRALLLLVIDARAEELVARLVAFGEVAAGLGLVLGAFT